MLSVKSISNGCISRLEKVVRSFVPNPPVTRQDKDTQISSKRTRPAIVN